MHIDNVDLEHFPTNEVAQRLLTYVTRGWYDKSYVGKWIAFVGTSGVQMGWLASQADMLAEDWVFA